MKETMIIYLLLWCFKGRYSKPCFFAKKESPSSNYQIACSFAVSFRGVTRLGPMVVVGFRLACRLVQSWAIDFTRPNFPPCDSVKREIPQSHGGMNICLLVNCDIWIWGNLPRSHSIAVPCREIYQLPFCPWMWQVFYRSCMWNYSMPSPHLGLDCLNDPKCLVDGGPLGGFKYFPFSPLPGEMIAVD